MKKEILKCLIGFIYIVWLVTVCYSLPIFYCAMKDDLKWYDITISCIIMMPVIFLPIINKKVNCYLNS